MFLLMMADRHKRPNRSVRLPLDLEQQVDKIAAERGVSFNAVMVEAARRLVGGDTTEPTVVTPRPVLGYSKEQQARGKR